MERFAFIKIHLIQIKRQTINVEVSQSLGFLQTQVLITVFCQTWNLHTVKDNIFQDSLTRY